MLVLFIIRWLCIAVAVAVFGYAGAFVLGEFGQGRLVPTVAGALFGVVFGAFLAGARARLFDAMFPPGEPAHLRRMWVAPATRGLGLGRRLLTELEARAAERGATAVRLETNGALTEAITMYRGTGYREVDPFNDESHAHHWFEKTLP